MNFDKKIAWAGGVGLVIVGMVLWILNDSWSLGDPDKPPSIRAADSMSSNAEAISRGSGQDSVGGSRTAWSVADRESVEPDRLPPLRETFTDAVLVSLTSDMENWKAGTRVAFEIPHTGTTLESVIERVETGLAGNVSYIGRVGGQDSSRRVVVTVGARNAFAYIGSAQGSYEMVGNRDFGWLMTSAGMDRHVDYSKPDYYIPGDTGRDKH